MKRLLTFAVLNVIALGLIKLIHMLLDLGEVDWLVISVPIVMLYYGAYGLNIPIRKSAEERMKRSIVGSFDYLVGRPVGVMSKPPQWK